MRYIEHLIEPDRLLLCWQAFNSENRSRYIVGEIVQFIKEPNNTQDAQAIRIERSGEMLGYVNRGHLNLFHTYLEAGFSIRGEVARKNGTADRPLIYIYTSISLTSH